MTDTKQAAHTPGPHELNQESRADFWKRGFEVVSADRDRLRADRDAWKAYAEHQEHCATCGEAISDCETGTLLRSDALSRLERP